MKGISRLQMFLGVLLAGSLLTHQAAGQSAFRANFTVSADEVQVNETITYGITVTNVLDFALSIVATNFFPSSVQILSVSNNYFGGSATNEGTSAVFIVPTVARLQPAQFTVAVRPTQPGFLTNEIIINAPQFNDFTNVIIVTLVTNAVVPTTDLAVSLAGPASGALVNDHMPYTVRVSNLGTTTVTNVTITNQFPAGIQFVSGNSNTIVTLPRLPGGTTTNIQYTLRPTTAGSLLFSASIGAPGLTDSNPGNNTASTNILVQPLVTGQLIATNLGPMMFNPQHSLMEQPVRLVNVSTSTVASARLVVRGLTTNWLYNAVGTNTSSTGERDPFVVHADSLEPGQSVDLLLEFVVTNRLPVVIPNSNYVAVAMPAVSVIAPGDFTFGITNILALPDGAILIEFPATPGRSYTILYSGSQLFTNTLAAQPPVVAQADRVQWIDDGPPKTVTHPTNSATRFYRALLNP